jgi:hypothetical protein
VSIVRDLLTGLDGQTHDIGRWAGALGVLAFVGLATFDVVGNHTHFDCQAFGIGFGALAAGVGAMLKLKLDTEPKP